MQENSSEISRSSVGWEQAMLQEIVQHYQEERKAARRGRWIKRTIWLVIGCIFLITMVQALFSSGSDYQRNAPHIAVIRIHGEISAGSILNGQNVVTQLEAAFENPQTKAVILHINSPGGSPVQSGMIADAIFELRKQYPKTPIYSVAEDICASGAYYIASATEKIYANQASLVGSIGVFMGGFGFSELMKDWGVERRLITAGDNKAMLDPFSPLMPTHRAHLQQLVNEIHQQFITSVKKGRADRLNKDPSIFSGLVWTGQQSLSLGVVDGIASLQQVTKPFKDIPLVDYSPGESLEQTVMRFISSEVSEQIVQKVSSQAYTLR